MKSALVWVIGIAVVFGGGFFGMKNFEAARRTHAYEIALKDLKTEFTKSSVGLSLLDAETYRGEIGIHLTKYFDELSKLAREYPEHYDIRRELKHGADMLAQGKMQQDHKMARDERINITLQLFDKMKSGQYRPLYTVADKTFRFDIHNIAPDKSDKQPTIAVDYIHWGAFGPVNYHSIVGNIRAKQEAGKPVKIPQIVGEGQPPALQIKPERWVKEFPPGMEVGYYHLPAFPPQADAIQLSFNFGINTIGGTEVQANIAFPDIAISDTWKVGDGQKWNAQERFADDSELQAAGGKPTQN